jgi:choline-sulfatase
MGYLSTGALASHGFWENARHDEIKHSAHIWADGASDYLLKQAQSDTPFFMYVGFNSPHDPRQSPREFVDRYPQERIRIPPNYLPEFPFDQGDHYIGRDERLAPFPRTREAVQLHRAEYYALITYMDTQIGRILDALEKSGKAENTGRGHRTMETLDGSTTTAMSALARKTIPILYPRLIDTTIGGITQRFYLIDMAM